MTLQSFVDQAVVAAHTAMIAAGEDPVIGADIEGYTWAPHALHLLATEVAKDPERKHLLMRTDTITLDGQGEGTFPDSTMTEFLEEGSVRDGDTSANNGYGNVLVRVHGLDDFIVGPLPTQFGYYNMSSGKIRTRAINSGGFQDTFGPLTVDCAFVPTADEVPDEITDDAVQILARLIRNGVNALPPMQ